MLVLNRKVGNSIQITDDIQISVVKIQGNQVLLGIDAPKSIPIYRGEIYEALNKEDVESQVDANEA